jgi:hypothetical protein
MGKQMDMDAEETVVLQQFTEAHKNTHHEGGTSGAGDEEEEEEDAHGGQRVRCAQQ